MNDLKNIASTASRTPRLPVLFIGHGSPMNAVADNAFTRSLAELGRSFAGRPNAVLVVSAHWLTRGTRVAVTSAPETIYDFYGFPPELYQLRYPAPGAPKEARAAKGMVHMTEVAEDAEWGLDHGAWSVLRHMFPEAKVPVFQLSIDIKQPPPYHLALGEELKDLRERGVLILGSGNIVHNLYEIDFDEHAKPYAWAEEFDDIVKLKLESRDVRPLVEYQTLGASAARAVPTNDHYLPMLYALGASDPSEQLRFTYEEIQNASVSMRCFQVG